MSDQAQWDALAALLKATGLGEHVYDYGQVPGEDGVPGTTPDFYALLTLERRYVPPNKPNGNGRTGWRVTVRFVDTSAANARLVGTWVSGAFETTPGHGKRITVDGVTSTALTYETAQPVEPDDGRFSGSVAYTYAL